MGNEVWMAVAMEMAQRLENARLQAAREPRPGVLQLEWRIPGETLWQILAVDSGGPTTYFTQRRWPNAPTPPRFLSRLRKMGVGLRLEEMEWNDDTLSFTLLSPSHPTPFILTWSPTPEGGIRLFQQEKHLETIRPLFSRGPIQAHPFQNAALPSGDALHATLEKYWRTAGRTRARQRPRELRKQIRKQLKKTRRLLRNVEQDLSRAEQGQEQIQRGEWLKPIASSADSQTPRSRIIHPRSDEGPGLRPAAQRTGEYEEIFHTGSRLKAAEIRILERLEEVEEKVRRLESAGEAVECAESEEQLQEIRNDSRDGGG